MRKVFISMLAVSLMLVSFVGCKNAADPKNFSNEMGKILEANENDCAKAADELYKFLDENGVAWSDAVIKNIKDAKAEGKKFSNREEAAKAFNLDDPDEIYKNLKCYKSKAVENVIQKKWWPLNADKILPVLNDLYPE